MRRVMPAQASRGRQSARSPRMEPVRTRWVIVVGVPSPTLDRRIRRLQSSGFSVTHAESICHAEMYSEAQYFDAAVYDDSLSEVEQVSLARIMRVRWPWMRLVRCDSAPIRLTRDVLFDASSASEANLPETLLHSLA